MIDDFPGLYIPDQQLWDYISRTHPKWIKVNGGCTAYPAHHHNDVMTWTRFLHHWALGGKSTGYQLSQFLLTTAWYTWNSRWRHAARADSRFAPSQWQTALLCNDVSHWLGTSLESTLWHRYSFRITDLLCTEDPPSKRSVMRHVFYHHVKQTCYQRADLIIHLLPTMKNNSWTSIQVTGDLKQHDANKTSG